LLRVHPQFSFRRRRALVRLGRIRRSRRPGGGPVLDAIVAGLWRELRRRWPGRALPRLKLV
jgi:hypothetical protein